MMHESHWVISGGWNRDKIHHKPLKKLLMKMRWKDAVVLWVLRRILVWICAIPIQLFSWDGKSTNALLWNHICGLTDHYNMQYVPFHKTGLHSIILFFCFKYIHLIIIFFKKRKRNYRWLQRSVCSILSEWKKRELYHYFTKTWNCTKKMKCENKTTIQKYQYINADIKLFEMDFAKAMTMAKL